ncbi:MAG: hypothetical protein ISR55_03040 [Bacteroidetes bacterium]|nr:hypothetical protein [Bacteroidota bacterium]
MLEIIHPDFTDFARIEDLFNHQDIAFYCLGVYTGEVKRDQFREITIDFTRSFANSLKNSSPDATFCFLSGGGADQTEKSRMIFAKDKGLLKIF